MRVLAQFDLKLNALGLGMLTGDKWFLFENLKSCDPAILSAALEDYKKVWLQAEEAEPVEHMKQNAGRRAANTFIREVVCPSLCETTKHAA